MVTFHPTLRLGGMRPQLALDTGVFLIVEIILPIHPTAAPSWPR